MDSYVVTILPGGRITIPAALRKDLDLQPGDTLEYWGDGREVYLRKADVSAPDPVARKSPVPSATDTPRRNTK